MTHHFAIPDSYLNINTNALNLQYNATASKAMTSLVQVMTAKLSDLEVKLKRN